MGAQVIYRPANLVQTLVLNLGEHQSVARLAGGPAGAEHHLRGPVKANV